MLEQLTKEQERIMYETRDEWIDLFFDNVKNQRGIDKLPEGATEVPNSPIALGEKHGHAHALTGNVKRYSFQNRILFLVLANEAVLQHTNIANLKNYNTDRVLPIADHQAHKLPQGVYEFFIQNEYNPYEKIMQKVID